jgi:hypothetical protein
MILFALFVIALGALTWVAGWWGIALGSLVIGFAYGELRGIARITAFATVVAWSILLLADAIGGRFGALASAISGVLRIPSTGLVAITLLFAALLAWSAAVIGSELAHSRATRAAGTFMHDDDRH